MKVLSNQKGFTLIELIIVIVVLGILAAVAIPQYVNMVDDAKAASNVGYVAGLRSAMSINYAAQRLGKPPCVNATGATTDATPNATNTNIEGCVNGTRPSSLSQSGGGWTGFAPALVSGNPSLVNWTIAAAAAGSTNPILISCGTFTSSNQC